MRKINGFTLIELLLYIGLVTIILTSLVTFAWNIVVSSTKSSTQQEVYSQARYISEKLKQEIRNSNGINMVSSTQISLVQNPPDNPTVISLTGNSLYIQKGTGSPIVLNSQDTSITNLVFTDYTSSDAKTKNINFTFSISSNYSGGSHQYKDSIVIESDAEVRSN